MVRLNDNEDFSIVEMSVIKGEVIKARFKVNFGGLVTVAGLKICYKGNDPPYLLPPRETFYSKKGVKKISKIVELTEEQENSLLAMLVQYYELLLKPDTEIEIINEQEKNT